MCTFTLAWQIFEETPIAVGANRDEFYDRPSEAPTKRDWEATAIAPMDQEAEGTWIGYNEHGLLAAITNRWYDGSMESARSRGLLVRDTLGCTGAEAACRLVERELDTRQYDGFNLVLVDETAAILIEWDGSRRVKTLQPGVHVVVNVGANGQYTIPSARQEAAEQQASNADAVRMALQPEPGEDGESWVDRAGTVIADHDYGVCLHGDEFGTVSSSLVLIGENGVHYEYANGPPCETVYDRINEVV